MSHFVHFVLEVALMLMIKGLVKRSIDKHFDNVGPDQKNIVCLKHLNG